MKSYNLDKLDPLSKLFITWMFENQIVGWTKCYMVEVKLDEPVEHLLNGGGGLTVHGGNGSKCYSKHFEEDDWACIHCEDEDWKELGLRAPTFQELMALVQMYQRRKDD